MLETGLVFLTGKLPVLFLVQFFSPMLMTMPSSKLMRPRGSQELNGVERSCTELPGLEVIFPTGFCPRRYLENKKIKNKKNIYFSLKFGENIVFC